QPCWNSPRSSSQFLTDTATRPGPQLLGLGDVLPGEGRLERVPGEAGAFHAGGKFPDAGEHGELADRLFVNRQVDRGRHDLMELVEQYRRIVDRLTLDGVAHQRRGGLRDR